MLVCSRKLYVCLLTFFAESNSDILWRITHSITESLTTCIYHTCQSRGRQGNTGKSRQLTITAIDGQNSPLNGQDLASHHLPSAVPLGTEGPEAFPVSAPSLGRGWLSRSKEHVDVWSVCLGGGGVEGTCVLDLKEEYTS